MFYVGGEGANSPKIRGTGAWHSHLPPTFQRVKKELAPSSEILGVGGEGL